MNEVHRIDLPRIVLIGRGVIESLGDVFQELGLQRPLLVTGRKTYEIAGRRVRDILKDKGFEPSVAFCSRADLDTVERVRKQAKAENVDSVIGVGGGRTIDVAKLSAEKSQAFFVSVPTTAAHDGIASSLASIKGLGRPYSLKAVSPIAVLADSRIVAESPYRFTASGCGDVISKAVSVRDWRLAHEENGDYYGEYAGSLALMSSNLVMRNAKLIGERTEEGYRTLLEALVSCGVAMSIAGSSRPCSGSAHLFSHTLDMLVPDAALHGEQCGVGAIMMAKLHGVDWQALKESLRIIGAPTNANELGVEADTIVEALVKAREIRPERYTILSKAKLTHENARDLARECGII
ncbi:NAD(P)-dependent glycerol-1-phosphate dehydrogenase [Candidatus Bathyarchaeota archaeon]|nr:MAG: NAD(P)-dependent glycerol-1-phosphate dehydrogenase [Candidatus Bathyarchaeota archaeon]